MVEFLAVAMLTVVAVLLLAQMALWVWTRGVAVNAAHEGARTAAETGRTLDDGVSKTQSVLHDGLGRSAGGFSVTGVEADGQVGIEAVGRAPVILPFLGGFDVRARATTHDEDDLTR
ncbi:MAG TPA: TadE family protein [Acidimicrobiia bacterium]|nr:TadE family protein [Acidimicrobiia bacterium]